MQIYGFFLAFCSIFLGNFQARKIIHVTLSFLISGITGIESGT